MEHFCKCPSCVPELVFVATFCFIVLATAGLCGSLSFCLSSLQLLPPEQPSSDAVTHPVLVNKRRRLGGKSLLKIHRPRVGTRHSQEILVITEDPESGEEIVFNGTGPCRTSEKPDEVTQLQIVRQTWPQPGGENAAKHSLELSEFGKDTASVHSAGCSANPSGRRAGFPSATKDDAREANLVGQEEFTISLTEMSSHEDCSEVVI